MKNISYTYDSRKQVLNKINISIKKNNITAIVGKSGIGKSTIIDLILSLNDPSSGSILLDDDLIANYDLQTYRNQIMDMFLKIQYFSMILLKIIYCG